MIHDHSMLAAQWISAEAEKCFQGIQAAHTQPHVLMRPAVFPDGDQWCALYGASIQEGVAGFGSTPADAVADFNKNWDLQRAKK